MIEISSPVRYLKGIGESRERLLNRLGVSTVGDLIFYFPSRYEDRRNPTKLSELQPTAPGEKTLVIARIVAVEKRRTNKKNFSVTSALLSDEGGVLIEAVWFNIPGLEKVLQPGKLVSLFGRVEIRGGLQLSSPEIEVIEDENDAALAIVPIYSTTSGLSQKILRRAINFALDNVEIEEFIPDGIRKLPSVKDAVKSMHSPIDGAEWLSSRNRLAFDELFLLQVGLGMRRRIIGLQAATPLNIGTGFNSFISNLPFKLTNAQERVINEIIDDLKKPHPMNRLLQGDVGSGKTIVAAAALMAAADSGKQGALMVPTEILALQHFSRLRTFFPDIAFISGSQSIQERRKIHASLESGDVKIIVGTHALFSESVSFADLGLVIVDEQHRFGVLQKQSLIQKSSICPHVLVMTATPIPRTLTLSVYGDLSVSVIDELPVGRQTVETRLTTPDKIRGVLNFALKMKKEGRQIYWVCPMIEENETLASAVKRCEDLRTCLKLRTDLIHGKMSGDEKSRVMKTFEIGDIDLLVATSVIEVGLDVPNASVMVIEGADRFGLSQLHQLRGRIGRGDRSGWCILVAKPKTAEGKERLDAMLHTNDGFKIAEIDLKLRGPGEVCGVRQHGVTDFRVANLMRDQKILIEARAEAEKILSGDPQLENEPMLRNAVMSRLGNVLDIAKTA